jgi:hypothetical protein
MAAITDAVWNPACIEWLGLSEQLGERHRAFVRHRQRRQAIQGWSIRKAIDLSACSRVKPAAGSQLRPLGSNDFGMPSDRKPCRYVAGDRPT